MPPKPSHNHNFTSGLNYYSRQYLVSQMNTTNKNFRIAHNNSSPPSLQPAKQLSLEVSQTIEVEQTSPIDHIEDDQSESVHIFYDESPPTMSNQTSEWKQEECQMEVEHETTANTPNKEELNTHFLKVEEPEVEEIEEKKPGYSIPQKQFQPPLKPSRLKKRIFPRASILLTWKPRSPANIDRLLKRFQVFEHPPPSLNTLPDPTPRPPLYLRRITQQPQECDTN